MSELSNETVEQGLVSLRDAVWNVVDAMKEQTRELQKIERHLHSIWEELAATQEEKHVG